MVSSLARFCRSRLLTPTVSFFLAALLVSTCTAQTGPQTPPVLLQMIRDESVHNELQLNDDQRDQVLQLLKSVDGPWFRSRILAAEQQRQQIEKLTAELQSQLARILEAPQVARLRQLERQALGTRMVLSDDVADSLGLTASQRDVFRDAFQETDKKAEDIRKRIQGGETSPETAGEELNRLKAKERKSLADSA